MKMPVRDERQHKIMSGWINHIMHDIMHDIMQDHVDDAQSRNQEKAERGERRKESSRSVKHPMTKKQEMHMCRDADKAAAHLQIANKTANRHFYRQISSILAPS